MVEEPVERELRKLRRADGTDLILPADYYEMWKPKTEQTPLGIKRHYLGVPQGGNISPLLSMLGLVRLYELTHRQGASIVMYADDGIMYSNKKFDPDQIFGNRELIEDGIVRSLSKSG